MHYNLNEVDKKVLECDVCIVGSGPSGLSLVSKYLDKNKKIIILESGNLEIDGMHDELNNGKSIGPRELDIDSSRIRTFGGGGKLWAGVCRHFSHQDFTDNNWPINYKNFIKYYQDAYKLFGLDSNFNFEQKSVEKYYTYQYLKDIFNYDTNFKSKTYLQSSSENRDLTNIFGSKIINSTNIHLITNATAIDFDINSMSYAKTIIVSSLGLKKIKISSKIFVLCMGALESSRFIMNSKISRFINNEILGTGFMSHPGFSNVGKIYLQNKCIPNNNINKINHDLNYFTVELNNKIRRENNLLGHGFSFKPVNTKNKLLKKQYSKIFKNFNYLKIFDSLKCRIENSTQIPFEWNVNIGIEQEFSNKNFIKLSNKDLDIFDKPKLEIFWDNISQKEIETINFANKFLSRQIILSKLGIMELSDETSNGEIYFQQDSINHHIGMTKMSNNSSEGVVDKNLKIHGVENIYLSSSSVFPSSSSVNPTLTIAALSLRLADHLLEFI
tara:strand:- start:2874 stop:4370 length:1497 start_codon:yes stop_codon:yes gene_type:complete